MQNQDHKHKNSFVEPKADPIISTVPVIKVENEENNKVVTDATVSAEATHPSKNDDKTQMSYAKRFVAFFHSHAKTKTKQPRHDVSEESNNTIIAGTDANADKDADLTVKPKSWCGLSC